MLFNALHTVKAYIHFFNLQGIRNAGLVGQNVRSLINCFECLKPRCIYSKRKLTTRELRGVSRILEKYDYSCGADIIPEGKIFVGYKTFLFLQWRYKNKIHAIVFIYYIC